jgi:hypothetical protein
MPEAESLRFSSAEIKSSPLSLFGVFRVARSIFALFKDLSPSNKQYEADVKSFVISSEPRDSTRQSMTGRTSFRIIH